MKPVIAVVGLEREGAVLRGLGVRTVAQGGSPDDLVRAVAARARDAAGIISFGMAGALDPQLRVGDWVIGDNLVGTVAATADPRWRDALIRQLPGCRTGAVHCDHRMILDVAEKRRIALASGAIAVDMESAAAARAAARAGLPFAILRCISDAADEPLPPAIAVSMAPGGGIAFGAVIRSIMTRPSQLPVLLRTLGHFGRAYAELKRGAKAVGPRLAFDRR